MKVKIKKNFKTREYKLIKSWEDVTLENWLKLIDYTNEDKSTEALKTITELSDIPKKLVKELQLRDVAIIMGKIAEMQSEQDTELKKIIKINGVKYGFFPDLNSLSLGEWSDLETMIKVGIEKNMPNIMAILFRPIVNETDSGVYTIEAYDGDIAIRSEEMKKMSAEQVQNALVFFYNLGKELCKILPLYLMKELKETKTQLHQTLLQKSGGTLG